MKVTGKNLLILNEALVEAIPTIRNMIVTCPNRMEYIQQIEELEKTLDGMEAMKSRVQKAIKSQQLKVN